jgi:hypothetical protein
MNLTWMEAVEVLSLMLLTLPVTPNTASPRLLSRSTFHSVSIFCLPKGNLCPAWPPEQHSCCSR